MTTFDDRDKGFENKFAHEEELAFRVVSRRNRLLGQWAAHKLGKSGAEAEQYGRGLALAAVEGADISEMVIKDLQKGGVHVTAKEIRAESELLLLEARKQIMGKA
ncbi:MAG: DUF1476 domain-containing protein [Pseudomonadota bacterium]|nr:DUF1476 domain-containing protein [Pseudomonadota bacterium]